MRVRPTAQRQDSPMMRSTTSIGKAWKPCLLMYSPELERKRGAGIVVDPKIKRIQLILHLCPPDRNVSLQKPVVEAIEHGQ